MPEDTAATPARRLSARSDAVVLSRLHRRADAADLMADVIRAQFPGEVALVSSFGADSAVLLHMASRIDPAVPVLFLETGMLFPETLDYQRALARSLGLSDVRLIRPDAGELAADDPDATLHAGNPDGCCYLRKTLPLRRALAPFRAWITGRKRFQATSRAGLELFEEDDRGGRLKVNPLAGWSAADVRAYMDAHALPRHPLVARGYPSIGCAPCTSAVGPGEADRAGRWRGSEKVECGIHFEPDGTVRRLAP